MDSGTSSTQTSAWGGFLKKAMEGVEQQLDRVLENPPPKVREATTTAKKESVTSQASRSASIANSRMTLQERLAASVAKSRTGSPKTVMSGDEGGTSSVVSTRDSSEITALDVNGSPGKRNGSISPVGSPPPLQLPASPVKVDVSVLEDKDIPLRTETPDLQVITGEEIMIQSPATVETPKQDDLSLRVSSEPLVPESPQQTQLASPLRLSTTSLPLDTDPATTDILTTLRTELANAESRRLEESQQSADRINALEQKLKLLSQTTLAHTREISADTTAGTWEKKLADREEKIALLLDEGEKLAKIELTLMTTIKTLRTKQKEDASALSSALSRAEKAEKQLVEVKAQLKKANEIEKKNTERLKAMYKIETANEALKRERDAAQVTIASLQSALEEAVTRADDAESKVQTEALEKERGTNVELQEKLDRLTTEYSLAEDRYKSEIADLKGRLEKEQLSAKSMQIDLSTEINTLESKLEVLRARAEESSTSATSSAQAKLLRQVEMLQTQHTIASQNWQRIEDSLQLRTSSLEKEKIDLTRRFDEEKKKVKEILDSKRTLESQIQDVRQDLRKLENDLLKSQSENHSLRETINSLETQLIDQEASFSKEKESLQTGFETTLDARLKEERQKWEEEQHSFFPPPPLSATLAHFNTPNSPRPSGRNLKSASPQPDLKLARGSAPPRTGSYGDISQFRRPSRNYSNTLDVVPSPTSFGSPTFTPPHLLHNTLPEDEEEREFFTTSRGESPRNTVVDAVSVSATTSTAGPNINIIERMSAAVRRLESDLAATKDELSRSMKQRDEAREECVKLMSEVEEKRNIQNAIKQLQTRYDELDNRYNEALVLLGEKSERVEELQLDIIDLKEGYQHALQRLVGENR